MRGQEMTESTKTSPLSETSTFITSIADAIRPNVGAVAVNSNGHGAYADLEKLSTSE